MNEHTPYLARSIFIAAVLVLGCSSGSTLGCGSSGGGDGPTVDSELLGIYQVDRYQGSEGGCDQLMDLSGAPRLVLYSAPSTTEPDEARLVGQFCDSVDNCRDRVADFPTAINYAFLTGSDTAGWRGWGIVGRGSTGEDCVFEVQTHVLASPSDKAITIDTRQVETTFPAAIEEGATQATCSAGAAIDSITDDSPCKTLFSLGATFEAAL